jgi:hypothetical protein
MITVDRASLTISSPTIDAATMTRRLGIEPSGSPESRADFDPRRHTRWILHFTDEGDGGSELQGGFAALRKLLNTVLPRLAELDSLRAEGCEVSLWWSGDSSSDQGSFNMSPALIHDLSRLRLDLRGTVNSADATEPRSGP